jgi:hypothetical protein
MNARSLQTIFGHEPRGPSRRDVRRMRAYARSASTDLVTRERVDALVATPPSIESIFELVGKRRHGPACVAALARAVAGLDVPVEVMEAVLPGVNHATSGYCLVAVTSGDRAAGLLRLVEKRRFRGFIEGELVINALFAAWRVGDRSQVRPRLIPLLQGLCEQHLCPVASSLVAIMVSEISDEPLAAAAAACGVRVEPECQEWLAQFEAALAASGENVRDRLLAEGQLNREFGGITVQSAPRVGRNEPCPCGSGRKSKRCCGSGAAEPVVATTGAAPGAGGRSASDAGAIPTVDDLRELFDAERWEAAASALDEMTHARALTPVELDALRLDLITGSLHHHHYDLARDQRAKMSDPAKPLPGPDMVLAIVDRRPDAFEQIHAVAWPAILGKGGTAVGRALAVCLLQLEPALGLLVARGCLDPSQPVESEQVLKYMKRARERLNLDPEDPYHRFYRAVRNAEQVRSDLAEAEWAHTALADEAKELRTALSKADGRQRSLEAQLAERDATLWTAQTELAALSEVARAEDERRALRSKIAELKEIIRVGVEERQQLRHELAEMKAVDESSRPPPRAAVEGDPGDGDLEAVIAPPIGAGRGPLFPRFESGVTHALRRVRSTVAAEALRTVGELAAGDTVAWQRVKQARDMRTPLYLVRIGIHHRMFVRVDGDALIVVDLVSREDMDLAIHRLRSLT